MKKQGVYLYTRVSTAIQTEGYSLEAQRQKLLDYAKYKPKRFMKAFIGMTMDGLLVGESFTEIVKKGNGFWRRFLIVMFSPLGFVLYLKYKE